MSVASIQRQPAVLPRTGHEARLAIRRGEWTGPTSGIAPGFVQGNLAILPGALASDFMRFCQLNPKPCPLLAVGAPGDWRLPSLGRRSRHPHRPLPLQGVPQRRAGRRADRLLKKHWRDDLVIFALGCSFSFEDALMQDGIELRHITNGSTVPMYRTSIETTAAGPFHGPLVVSMRPMKPADAIRAIQITTRFPAVHGAPVHIGLPEQIGIKDIMKPDYGDPPQMKSDEMPVFWACGVTPQSVVATVKPEFCITHYPGCMLVTDRKNSEFAIM